MDSEVSLIKDFQLNVFLLECCAQKISLVQ